MKRVAQLKMIKEFQCPGCVCGGPEPEECGRLEIQEIPWEAHACFSCKNHVPGTAVLGAPYGGLFYLGLPRGFNKVGPRWVHGHGAPTECDKSHNIRLWLAETLLLCGRGPEARSHLDAGRDGVPESLVADVRRAVLGDRDRAWLSALSLAQYG